MKSRHLVMVSVFAFLMVMIVLIMLMSGPGPSFPEPSEGGSEISTEVVLGPLI